MNESVKLKSGDNCTFLDTPGHSAFANSRKKVLDMIDLVLLIVAADDGLQDQTLEIINNIKKNNKRILVVVNKIDKSNANTQKVFRQLLENEIVLERNGGDIQAVEISALKKTNLDKLEEAILMESEFLQPKTDKSGRAEGIVISSTISRYLGRVAKVFFYFLFYFLFFYFLFSIFYFLFLFFIIFFYFILIRFIIFYFFFSQDHFETWHPEKE